MQIEPLPIGPGGNSPAKQQLNQTNDTLTMMAAQAQSDIKYDEPSPQPLTTQSKIEAFCTSPNMLIVVGVLFIAYGIVSK